MKRISEILAIILLAISFNQIATAGSVGPFVLTSSDSSSSVRLQFAGQMRMKLDSRDHGPDNDRTNDLFMEARRLRLTLSGTVYDNNLSYKLHLSTAPKSLELMDFYFNYKYKESLNFRFGQFKAPFTRYRIQSFQKLSFADWAIVTKYFGSERQIGFALHNGYEKPPVWGYVIGLFGGYNARASHAVGLSKVYGDDPVNPSDLANPGKAERFHPELFIHAIYNANQIRIDTNSDEERLGLRYSFALSAAYDCDPTEYHDFALRLAPELMVKYMGLTFLTIGYGGYSEIGRSSDIKTAMTGGLIQASYRINERYEFAVRYAFVDFSDDLINDARQRAEILIEDSGDDNDVIDRYADAGQITKETELTAGFNIYFIGHSLKWQNDFGLLRHTMDDDDLDDYLIRTQFQLTF